MVQDPTWPSFLNLFDSDPDEAFARFYEYAMPVLNARPPRMFSSMTAEEREDCLHDIIFHCVKDDFRVLRLYENRGKAFSAWLYSVAHHKSLDWRRSGREAGASGWYSVPGVDGEGPALRDAGPGPDEKGAFGELVEIVKETILQLSDYCRLLLQLAADELTIKEMVVVMGLPADQNKKVSDDLRYCRGKLRKRLAEQGYEPELTEARKKGK